MTTLCNVKDCNQPAEVERNEESPTTVYRYTRPDYLYASKEVRYRRFCFFHRAQFHPREVGRETGDEWGIGRKPKVKNKPWI